MGEIQKRLMKHWREQVNAKTLYCYLCGKLILRQSDLSADHVIPKSKGGLSTAENLQPAHKLCNSKKGDKSLQQYLKQMRKQR